MSFEEQKVGSSVESAGTESFIDEVLGGEEKSQSPEKEKSIPQEVESDPQADEGNSPIPDDEEGPFSSDDSIKEKREEVPDDSALKQEVEVLKKRLHDTQSAMHKATGERSKLQKELEELKAKQKDEDDWFSEDDKHKVEQLESDLKKSEEEVNQITSQGQDIARQAAEKEWDAAAAPVIAKNPDFEKVVYDDLVALLDASNGNAQVRADWQNLKDKSPSAVYAFAKRSLEVLEFQRDPEAYKEKLRKQSNVNLDPDSDGNSSPIGKEGLDMLPSADVPIEKSSGRVSFVDELFGQ